MPIERTAGNALNEDLHESECERRWDEGWIIGGYAYPLRDEIIKSGGLWLARHKVWVMPDRETWTYIRSLLPGDF